MYANEVLSFPVAGADVQPGAEAGSPQEIADGWRSRRTGERVRPRTSIDTLLAGAALIVALILTNPLLAVDGLDDLLLLQVPVRDLLLWAVFLSLWPQVLTLSGVYLARQTPARSEVFAVLVACSAGSLLALGMASFSSAGYVSGSTVGTFWVLSAVVTLSFRGFARAVNTSIRPRVPRRVLIVGSGLRALKLSHQVAADPQSFELIGFVDDSNECASQEVSSRLLGRLDVLEEILMRQVVDEVLIALPIKSCYSHIQSVIQICERVGVESKYLADAFRCSLARPHFEHHRSRVPVMSMKVARDDHRMVIKRAIDFAGALVGLVLLAPVLVAIAAAIKLTDGGPVFFAQERYGKNKRRFRMYKFRTMVVDAERLQANLESMNEAVGPVFKIKQDPRITRVGRFLRKTSLDELPQLFNVLKGEMSLVGPRPLPVRDVQLFDQAWFMRRFSVAPGLTCLWQISGRSNLGFDDWVTLDLQYIDEWSLGLDMQILMKTVPAVVRGVGAA